MYEALRTMNRLACGTAVIAITWGVGSDVRAAETVGETVVVVSEVRGTLDQTTRELAIQDNVFSDEIIETAPDAATRMVFLDGTELSLGPASRVVLDRYIYDPNSGTGELVLEMVGGVFEFASGNMPKDSYDIRTPFGNLAVRGTVVVITVGDGLVVDVDQGAVEYGQGDQPVIIDQENCGVFRPQSGSMEILSGDDCDEFRSQKVIMRAMLGGTFGIEPAAGPAAAPPDDEPEDTTGSRRSDEQAFILVPGPSGGASEN